MSYFIARKNVETGKFELQWNDDKPKEYYVEQEAINAFELSMIHNGSDNVMLLEQVSLDINVTIKKV